MLFTNVYCHVIIVYKRTPLEISFSLDFHGLSQLYQHLSTVFILFLHPSVPYIMLIFRNKSNQNKIKKSVILIKLRQKCTVASQAVYHLFHIVIQDEELDMLYKIL